MQTEFSVETYFLCRVGVVNGNETIDLFDIRLPQKRDLRIDVIKRVLNYMKDLRRWFTLTNERRVQYRLVEFLDSLPYSAYNDLKLTDIAFIPSNLKIEDGYSLYIGGKVYNLEQSTEEFSIMTSMSLMM
jgi:hypothetical protein